MKNICILFMLCSNTYALAPDKKEVDYQTVWCNKQNGVIEYQIKDSRYPSRIDCLTEEYAIEFDFLHKWPEALSQSLYYAKMTNKKPGVVLIIKENSQTLTHLNRLLNTVSGTNSNIRFWLITDENP